MIDNPRPDSGCILASIDILQCYAKTALMYEELRAAIDDGHESMTHADALAGIAAIRAENETLHTGYAAARLEIESLQARIKTMAEEHADELMVAHMGGRMRAAQPAGAQQPTTQTAPQQGDALTDTYVQQVPDKCDRIVWRGRYYHLPIDAAEHSYTEPSPMAKVAAALRQKAEQEDAAYQARRSDQGLMESEWGPMEDAPPTKTHQCTSLSWKVTIQSEFSNGTATWQPLIILLEPYSTPPSSQLRSQEVRDGRNFHNHSDRQSARRTDWSHGQTNK